jgi:hypothetical protein
MEFQVKPKFYIGERVYRMLKHVTHIRNKCSTCGSFNGNAYSNPTFYVEDTDLEYYISGIQIRYEDGEEIVAYSLAAEVEDEWGYCEIDYTYYTNVYESELFTTLEAAQSECDRKNKTT